MTAPTKGPYRAGEAVETIEFGVRAPYWMAQIYDADGQPFARIYGPTKEQAEANAQLLAAAWEMREVVRETKFNPCPAGTCRPDCEHCGRLNRALAALAKADGKETKNEHAK